MYQKFPGKLDHLVCSHGNGTFFHGLVTSFDRKNVWFCSSILYGVRLKNKHTGELGYDGPLYDRFLHMTDDMLGPSPMHIKYLSYV